MIRLDPIDAGAIDRLEPLWLALHAHHQRVAPRLAPFVDDDVSWKKRRRQYAEVLCGEGFGFIAHENGADIGYLLCAKRPMDWTATFAVPDSLWELVTIYVKDARRGQGVGAQLLGAMEERLAQHEIKSRLIGVIPDNRGAVALYQARGCRPTWLILTRFRRPAPAPQPVPAIATAPFDPAQVDALESLWLALHHHHQAVSPQLGPWVTDAASWPVIRALFRESAEAGLLFVAEENGHFIGLASAAIYDIDAYPSYSDTWVTGGRLGETKFLVVAPGQRGKGVGAALMERVDRELTARGVHDQFVGAIAPNTGAIRFYESRGFRPAWLELTRF